jgi:hypothetical protein
MTGQEIKTRAEEARSLLGSKPTRIGTSTVPTTSTVQPSQKVIVNREPLPSLSAQDFPPATSAQDEVITRLLNGPVDIRDYQDMFDKADRAYKTRLADLTIQAFSAQLFPGKDGQMVAASNDKQRDAAVDQVTSTDSHLVQLAINREIALRNLSHARNTFEGAKLAAQLLAAVQR